MPVRIAVAGKGGTGKTTLSALITTHFVHAGNTPILAVDADPNANLNEALGVEYDRSVVDTIDEIMNDGGSVPAGIPKSDLVEYQVHDALVESKGFDLLVMGHTEGPGCYCYANSVLRDVLKTLAGNYDYVIIDNEAGMEHLSRRTTQGIDYLLMISDATVRGIHTAGRIGRLVRELETRISERYLVINRICGSLPQTAVESIRAEELEIEYLEPYSFVLENLERRSVSLYM